MHESATGDCERLGQKTFHASRQTGGWVKAAGVVAAGGAQAQSGSKCCMNSCDALLCILSVRTVSIKVARIGANCRVNSCVALLSPKKFCGWAQRVASGAAALWSCNCGCSVRQYTFVKVQRWSAVALVLRRWVQLIRWCRHLQGGKSRLGAELRIAYCVRAGETATIQLLHWPAACRFQTGLTLEALLGRLKGMTGRRDTREITRDCEKMCEIGQEILGATWQTGGWRRPRVAGRAQVALEALLRRLKGLHRYERCYER